MLAAPELTGILALRVPTTEECATRAIPRVLNASGASARILGGSSICTATFASGVTTGSRTIPPAPRSTRPAQTLGRNALRAAGRGPTSRFFARRGTGKSLNRRSEAVVSVFVSCWRAFRKRRSKLALARFFVKSTLAARERRGLRRRANERTSGAAVCAAVRPTKRRFARRFDRRSGVSNGVDDRRVLFWRRFRGDSRRANDDRARRGGGFGVLSRRPTARRLFLEGRVGRKHFCRRREALEELFQIHGVYDAKA